MPAFTDNAGFGTTIDQPTILLVDVSVTFLQDLRQPLEAAGYAVLLATSGAEGLQIAFGQRPSAIFVDENLPGIEGATFIRCVRFDPALRRTACLLFTASDDRTAELHALAAGADAFVCKDSDFELILAKLVAALQGV